MNGGKTCELFKWKTDYKGTKTTIQIKLYHPYAQTDQFLNAQIRRKYFNQQDTNNFMEKEDFPFFFKSSNEQWINTLLKISITYDF